MVQAKCGLNKIHKIIHTEYYEENKAYIGLCADYMYSYLLGIPFYANNILFNADRCLGT